MIPIVTMCASWYPASIKYADPARRYHMGAIVKKRLHLERDLYTILQILSVSLFEQISLAEALTADSNRISPANDANQLRLFTF